MQYEANQHSFAVCAYKESPYLADCLDSLLAQTVRTNVFVATSTPTDGVRTLCRSRDVRLYERAGKSGLANDWNYAVGVANTPLVTIAHQDDLYKTNYAAEMLQHLSQADHALMFFSNYGELRDGAEVDSNKNLEVKRKLLRPISRVGVTGDIRTKRKLLKYGNAICCPSVTLVKPNIPLPLFKQGMSSNLDWEAWTRLANMDGCFVYSDDILMLHRIHSGSETSRIISDGNRTKEDLEMLLQFWPSPIARLINNAYKIAQRSNG